MGFSLPILSQILIVLVYKGYLAFVYDCLFNAKKSYYFLWSEYFALVLIAEEPLNNFSIINPLNFIKAEYNGGMDIPNNSESFYGARKIGISLGFSPPILSQILIVLVYEGYLAFVYDYLFNAKKSYYFLWSEYSTLVLIAEKPLNNFSIINT